MSEEIDHSLTYGNSRQATPQSNLHNDSNQSLMYGNVKRPTETPPVGEPNITNLGFGGAVPRHSRKRRLFIMRECYGLSDEEIEEITGKTITEMKTLEGESEDDAANRLAKEDAKMKKSSKTKTSRRSKKAKTRTPQKSKSRKTVHKKVIKDKHEVKGR